MKSLLSPNSERAFRCGLVLLCVAWGLTGLAPRRVCAQAMAAPAPGAPAAAVSAGPAAQAASSGSAVSASYVLSPNDAVQVEVYQEDDLRTTAVISRDGTINFPLLRTVKVGGLTQTQARDLITDKLRADYLVNPQVSLAVVRFASKRFTVLGQVSRPGSFELPAQESIDLLEAIAMAGGYTRIAEPSKITVKRRTNDKEEVFSVNAKRMAKNPGTERFTISPGDTITVAESIF